MPRHRADNGHMAESDEQITVIEYCDVRGIPVFHIPNGGSRNAREAANLKRQGVRKGVPDLFIPVPSGGYHGLFIEMKRADGKGRVSKEQAEWIRLLQAQGYRAHACNGAANAIALIRQHLGD